MNKKIEKKDGYYWIATTNTSKTGYPSLFGLLMDEYPAFYVFMVLILPVIVSFTAIVLFTQCLTHNL